jgi:hypothetical protein
MASVLAVLRENPARRSTQHAGSAWAAGLGSCVGLECLAPVRAEMLIMSPAECREREREREGREESHGDY